MQICTIAKQNGVTIFLLHISQAKLVIICCCVYISLFIQQLECKNKKPDDLMQNICVYIRTVELSSQKHFQINSTHNRNKIQMHFENYINTYYAKCSFQLFVQYLERKQISKMEAAGAFAHRDHMLGLP